MAAITKRIELEHIVWGWERRDQVRRFVLWLPRALAVGVIGFGITWLSLRLLHAQPSILISASVSVGVLLIVGLLVTRLRTRPLMAAVQHFDQTLGLQERTSTAIELLTGRIQTVDEIAGYQLEDAYRAAQRVDIRQAVPLVVRWREWMTLLILVIACGLMVWATQPPPADALSPATRDAIASAADDVRDITESVANDTTLEAGERQTLLDTLETSLDALETEPLSAEEAFASLSQVEDALKSQATSLRNGAKSDNATYEAAAQTLNPKAAPDSSDSGIAEFQKALQQMQQDISSGSSDSGSQSADDMQKALDQASQMMQDANPQMAQYMKDASEAMKNGDQGAAQDALNKAQQEAQNAQQSQDQREATAQSLEQAADNASQASQNLAQSEQSNESSQEGQPLQQGQQGQQNPQGQQNQQPGQSQSQQQGGQESPNAQQMQQGDGSQQGNPGQSDQGNNPNGPARQGENGQSAAADEPPSDSSGDQGAANGQDTTSQSGAGAGAGDQSGSQQNVTSGGGQTAQDNNPDGTGETTYEPIYAPQRITAQGSSDIVLDPEASNQPVQEGDFQANPNGESRVPYDQVFRQYSEAANQAIEGGYIPLGLRDVVQDYFTSIAPQK